MRMPYAPPQSKQLADRLGKFYRDFASDVTTHQRVPHFLEKNTWNILYFDRLLELVPEARLVHVRRDPRDGHAAIEGRVFLFRVVEPAAASNGL